MIRMRALVAVLLAGMLWGMTTFVAPAALAQTGVKLSEVVYRDCPADVAAGTVNTNNSRSASCYLVSGKATNPTGKPVYDADVFGRVFDANGDPVFQNRGRLGTLDEVPPGTSDFEIRITVSSSQPTPLRLEKFKATGFGSRVRR
jgi:hypothetical protein